jgi:hypothetical protein
VRSVHAGVQSFADESGRGQEWCKEGKISSKIKKTWTQNIRQEREKKEET